MELRNQPGSIRRYIFVLYEHGCQWKCLLHRKGDQCGRPPPPNLLFVRDVPRWIYAGKGCSVCGNTGYKGRTAIFEFIKITQNLQDLIIKNPSTSEIWNLASKEGSLSLFEDGIEKVKSGVTTLEELLRVAPPPRKDI